MTDRTSVAARTELLEVEAAAARFAGRAGSSAPRSGTLTVSSGSYLIVGVRKQLTGTQRLTVKGTGRLRIQN